MVPYKETEDKEEVGEDIGVDMNQDATGYEAPETFAITDNSGKTSHFNGVLAGNVSCEGEAESFQTVNLNEEHQSWDIDHAVEEGQLEEDPSILSLLCTEHLNGDPLAEVCTRCGLFCIYFLVGGFSCQFYLHICERELQDAEYEDFNFRSLSYDVGCSVEDPYRAHRGVGEQHGVDPALDTLVMDTPPELLQTPPDLSSLDVSFLTQ
jgi:hypothetical protein